LLSKTDEHTISYKQYGATVTGINQAHTRFNCTVHAAFVAQQFIQVTVPQFKRQSVKPK